jgi:LPS sulfotransferase NodH
MVNELRAHGDAYAECVSTSGSPQRLWMAHREIDGATLENGVLVNHYYPSPEMHAEAAEKLATACVRFLFNQGAGGSAGDADGATAGAVRFVIVCAERTGSSVLRGLLDSHPDCFVAGELFNARLMENDDLQGVPPAPSDEADLADLRRTDPVAFVTRAFEAMERRGDRAVGFKLMYGHADANVAVRDYLASEPNIRIIHIKRRNLLRRYLSERRAHTDVWAQEVDAHGSVPPPVRLQFVPSMGNFAYIELRQAEQEERFRGHRMLELFYKDLSSDPQAVGARAVTFLGLKPSDRLAVRFKKTGTDSLRDAITNYDELKASMLRWASFFEE